MWAGVYLQGVNGCVGHALQQIQGEMMLQLLQHVRLRPYDPEA